MNLWGPLYKQWAVSCRRRRSFCEMPRNLSGIAFNRDTEGSAGVRLEQRVNNDRQAPTPSGNVRGRFARENARRRSSLSEVGYGWKANSSELLWGAVKRLLRGTSAGKTLTSSYR